MAYKNLESQTLINISVNKKEGELTTLGVLCTKTGNYTGRSPDAKYIVDDYITHDRVDWTNNQRMSQKEFEDIYDRFRIHSKQNNLYLQECHVVRDPRHALNIDVWTEQACHSLFARNMFIPDRPDIYTSEFTVYHFPSIQSDPIVIISFTANVILISGTQYSGEIKKSIFTVLNFLFPRIGTLPMHCSVNVDHERKNPAIFFGLSGTGKTTLSADSNRILIGDDEHGWTDTGLTNFEGGCYAKTIKLSKIEEPQIWDACHSPGALLENVVINQGTPDFNDSRYTENTRASYPTSLIDNADAAGYVNVHPTNIIMLTCDSFGLLPPIAKLTSDQAVIQFLLGYTSKVAGTEEGVNHPVATFSPCFGLPFMPLSPEKYAEILLEKLKEHNVDCWLVNTGWTGGPYGVGNRIPISITREIIDHIHNGNLAKARTFKHKYTGLTIPIVSHNLIPSEILEPEKGWSNIDEYITRVEALMDSFTLFLQRFDSFRKQNQCEV